MTAEDRAVQIPMPWVFGELRQATDIVGIDVRELQLRVAAAIREAEHAAAAAERDACANLVENYAAFHLVDCAGDQYVPDAAAIAAAIRTRG